MLTRFSTERNQRKSPFLRLPGELRNKIYRCYLSTATINVETYLVGDIHIVSSSWSERTTYTRQENNLPLVCRQVYQESQPFHNNYHTLKVIIAKGSKNWLIGEVRYFSARRNLGTVRKLEFMENTALDLVRYYERVLAAGYNLDWTSTSRWLQLNGTFLLPALETVVWPGKASQVPLEKLEAAVRLVFQNSDIQVVSG